MSVTAPPKTESLLPKRRVITAAVFGNALEWFDFSSYAFFATYIAINFFGEGDSTSGLTSTFVVFAAGFIARPLGAIVLGTLGDIIGRKRMLMLTMSLMAVGTFIIGFAPPIWAIGAGAPILLLVGRLFQGFSAGGELGGAAAYLLEHAPKSRRGEMTGWLQASMGLSNAMSALIGVVVTTVFDNDTVVAWAWRIPFIIGLLIIPVAIYIRKRLDESDDFKALERERKAEPHTRATPMVQLVKTYPLHMVAAIVMSVLWQVAPYALLIYATSYYPSPVVGLGFTSNDAFLASLIGNLAMVPTCVLAGRLADRRGLGFALRVGAGILIVVPFAAYLVLQSVPTVPVLVIAHVFICIAVGSYVGVIPSAMARVFPTAVRSSGLSVAYNLAAIVFAGLTPVILTWAITGTPLAPPIYVSLAAVVTFIALPWFLKLLRRTEESVDTISMH